MLETGQIVSFAGMLAALLFLIACLVMHRRLRNYPSLVLAVSAMAMLALNPAINFVLNRYVVGEPPDTSLGHVAMVLGAARNPAMAALAIVFCVSFLLSALSIQRRP